MNLDQLLLFHSSTLEFNNRKAVLAMSFMISNNVLQQDI